MVAVSAALAPPQPRYMPRGPARFWAGVAASRAVAHEPRWPLFPVFRARKPSRCRAVTCAAAVL